VAAVLVVGAGAALVALIDSFVLVLDGQHQATDFRPYLTAAESILRGDSPYPAPSVDGMTGAPVYIYPPITALAAIPLTIVPLSVAEGLVVIGGALAIVATLFLLDVRDWRCYVVAFLWVPVLNAIGLGNLTIFLVAAAGFVWRYRDRTITAASALGVALAAKLLLWPLTVWLAATRRLPTALWTVAIAAGLLLVTWGAIGFAGFTDYPSILRVAHELWADDAYSVYALALDAGFSERVGSVAGFALAGGLLASSVGLGRRGGDRASFILAIAAALAFSPIVWRHYFALLIVPVAVARPRLGLVWFVPLLMCPVSEGIGNGSSFETSATLVIAALTIGLSLRAVRTAPNVVFDHEGGNGHDGERASGLTIAAPAPR